MTALEETKTIKSISVEEYLRTHSSNYEITDAKIDIEDIDTHEISIFNLNKKGTL